MSVAIFLHLIGSCGRTSCTIWLPHPKVREGAVHQRDLHEKASTASGCLGYRPRWLSRSHLEMKWQDMKTIQGLHIIGLQKRIGQGERRLVVKDMWHRITESIILLQHPSITSTRSNISYWILNHLISQTLVHFYMFLPCLARPCCFLSVPPSCNHDSSVKGLMRRGLSARDWCSFWRRSMNGSVSIHP